MISNLLCIMLVVGLLNEVNVLHSQPLVIDDTTRLWNTNTPAKSFESARTAYAEDAGLLFTATNDGVYVLRASDGAIVDSIMLGTSSQTNALDVACSRDARILCLMYRYYPLDDNRGDAMIMDYPSKTILAKDLCRQPGSPGGKGWIEWPFSRVSVSPSGRYVVVPWDYMFRVKIIDRERDTSWIIPGLPWRKTPFDDNETVCATWDGPDSENDENYGQCRVSWLSNPGEVFRTFVANYGSDVEDSELALSNSGRMLMYCGRGYRDALNRPIKPGFTVWDIESGSKIFDPHYEGGAGPLWGFGPDDSWFVAWLSHPVYGNGTYVFCVGVLNATARTEIYTTYFNDDFSKAYDIVRNSTKVSARQITTRIVPVSVEEELGTLRYPNVRRGPETTMLTIRLGTNDCELIKESGAIWNLFNSSMNKLAEGKFDALSDNASACQIESRLSVEPAPGMYILTIVAPSKGVKSSVKLMLD